MRTAADTQGGAEDRHVPEPFLRRVAAAYALNEPELLGDCLFVFPNKRSATFFTHHLRSLLTPPALLPATTSINEFVADLSELVEASRYDRLFIIYNEYRRITGEDVEFDRFIYWGDMLLSDFDDVDRYLVDPSALFVNVKRFREIRSNYLTEDQLRIIGRYWGGVEDYTADIEGFWQHVTAGGGERAAGRFVKLWEVLDELYHAYHRQLAERGLTSPGRLYRDAVQTVRAGDELEYSRYVFVGFNVLSASELRIFELLHNRGLADFYWDIPAPAYRGRERVSREGVVSYSNKAMRFISRNAEAFPSLYDIHSGEYDNLPEPEIRIINVPSRVGQAKVAGDELRRWAGEGLIDAANAIDTAVVMPDEGLFVTAVNSIPAEIKALNVTMGYPLKRTPVATFIKAVTSLHLRARRSGDTWMFFYEDVMALLAHSVAQTIDADASVKLADQVTRMRRFMVDSRVIADNYPSLAPIFTPVKERDLADTARYINGILDMLERALDGLESRRERDIHRKFLASYRLALSTLLDAATTHGVVMGEATAFQLLERALASETVPMKGEPLRGLQLMGVLETRALDFNNVIFMSMNERVFPRKSYTRSFIPDVLRKAYRMSTVEHQESIFAYYFFRLISRARRVTLLYDGRTVGLRHSEMSRYVVQLLYAFRPAARITHIGATFDGRAYDPSRLAVMKDERVMEKLRLYQIPGSGKNISASSLNVYIDCPMQFYLRHVEGLDIEDAATDYIDSSTFGKILHETAERLYATASPEGKYPATVTAEWIDRVCDSADDTIPRIAHACIDENYLKLDEAERGSSRLFTETRISRDLITDAIRHMLLCERERAPFTVIAAELPLQANMELVPGVKVNIRQYIDRVDRVDGRLRIVDYKTGRDPLSLSGWDRAFDGSLDTRPKAFVQLFFYCHVYRMAKGTDEPITPIIYSLHHIFTDGLPGLTCGVRSDKVTITDYRDFYQEFMDRLTPVVKEIFDPAVPFRQTEDVGGHACKFCRFKPLCGVNELKDQ
ncbi:MAG: PD-(D/E)XK nuclease family protein [Candidatus Amulumruptor caecigallinarius]|nr:PD-(D/E)XK nuclease family protein [Candidatus Amulumruptor caecigallinarius]MCM1396887.1 PD-(D/E)XK nuclease family protein [Candidatus Amulumruptor caecigallinarius]MCM1454169.1 PD-(D/E)XK nuclease family protein [bacterium]